MPEQLSYILCAESSFLDEMLRSVILCAREPAIGARGRVTALGVP
jgi:hypothetical protein